MKRIKTTRTVLGLLGCSKGYSYIDKKEGSQIIELDVKGSYEDLYLDIEYILKTKAKYHSAKRMAEMVRFLERDQRAIPEVVHRVAFYIGRNNVKMNPGALEIAINQFAEPSCPLNRLDVGGRYWYGKPDNVWVSRRGFIGQIPPKIMIEVANATSRTLDQLAARDTSAIGGETYRPLFMGYSPNLTARDILNYLHELGHCIHFSSNWYQFPCCEDSGNVVKEWESGLTEYGKDDFHEGFAEYFVAYLTAGVRLKEEYPLVFDFIDEVVNMAICELCLNSPRKKKPRKPYKVDFHPAPC